MRSDIKERITDVAQGKMPQGYTKTKGCLYPDDWKYKKLNSELSENRQRNYNNHFSKEDVLSVSGDFGVVNQIELLGRSYAGESVDNYHVVNIGDIVYTKSPLKANPYGIIKLNLGMPGIVSTLYAVYHCKNNIVGRYLNYYFQMDTFLNNYLYPLVKKGAKNDMKVNNEDVLKGKIAFPSIKEQCKIVEILNQCDKIIELKQQLIEEERNCKKWLMQTLLCDKQIYKKVKIGNITEVCTGATPSTKVQDYWGGDIRWMSSGELNYKRVYEVERRISERGLSNSGTKLLPEKCVLVGLAGQGKTRGTVAVNYVPLCTNQSIAAILPSKDFDTEYLFWNLENRYTELRILSSGDGARGGLNLNIIKNIVVYLPPLEEQQQIADILSSSARKLDLLEQELAQWQQKKKALMQLLLTGIVRVSV
ncbi:restriction endonuclease subunit S [Christensenella intestinihominis]|uniref:restriction endonuclease subunit S n=1 Tax=Christensenella intestinihominis TaxID=1851429 RepID=UPI0008369289|nr:restriction endonuclease subunit S [Christensenella intestinihominis]